jgi:predicted phage-related endonuclease
MDVYQSLTSNHRFTKEESNEAIERGTLLEPLIRKQFAIIHPEYKVINPPKNNWIFRRIDKPYMGASLDGLLVNKETKEHEILEIKTHQIRSKEDADIWVNQKILPQQYYVQALHYLNVTGFKRLRLMAQLIYYNFGKFEKSELREYVLNADELTKDLALEEKKITKFYEQYIVKHILPPVRIV